MNEGVPQRRPVLSPQFGDTSAEERWASALARLEEAAMRLEAAASAAESAAAALEGKPSSTASAEA